MTLPHGNEDRGIRRALIGVSAGIIRRVCGSLDLGTGTESSGTSGEPQPEAGKMYEYLDRKGRLARRAARPTTILLDHDMHIEH